MKFIPGQSGNPAGRSKSVVNVAKYIAHETGDFRELVDGLLAMWRDPRCPKRERLQAAQELLNRGLGKSLQTSELAISLDPPLPVTAIMMLPPDERLKWISAERARRALPPVSVDTAEDESNDDNT